MPNYYLNGDRYDIPDEVVADFEKDNPDAVISYRNGNDIYDIPVSEKEGFLKAYPKATLYDGETKSSTTREEVLDYPKDSPQLPSQSSMTTGAVLNDNSASPQRQLNPSPEEDKRTVFANYVREQLGNIDKELNKPREALPMPAGSVFIPSTAVAAAQRYGNAQTREQQDRYTSLQAARNFLDEADKVMAEAGRKGQTNFVSGALRGIRDKGFDPDTWMMGISETSYYNLLRQAAEKEERGEQLSSEEQQLLDAAAVNMAANAYYASDLGRGYKAGAVTAESIPFMLQFAVNPLSGAGKGIAKTILEHGIKRFGLNTSKRTVAGRAVRGAARAAGDAVAAAGVTATTGLGNVAEDAERRMAGDVQFTQDDNGDIRYAGRVNNVEDTGEAIARAFTSTFFENQSEMVGNYFAPIMRGVSGLVKRIPGVKQLSASKVGRLYRDIKDNPTYKEFTDRTQWHGAIGEYAEEVYNNLASVAMGDMTPEELVDLDNNIDTFLGVGLMSAVFGGIGAAGFARDRYTLNRDIRRFEADLTPQEMERWQAVKQVATSGDVEGVREFVKYTMRDDSLTPQEKKDEIAYIYNVMKQSAMENVAAEQTEEAVQAEADDIVANSDPQTNTNTECARIVVNDVGEQVEVPGHIVGYMGGQPLWKPDGAGPEVEAVVLKEGEYNPESIQSMPMQEVIDETAQAIREDAAEQARRESTYSPDIAPPSIGTTFADGAAQYQIVQQNPEGGWLATRTTLDEKGKPVQEVVPVTEQEYYDLVQAQLDAQEQQTAVKQATDGVSTGNSRRLNETGPQQPSVANQAQTLNVSGSNTAGPSLLDKPAENPAPAKSRTSPDEAENLTAPSRELDNASIPTDEKGNLLYHRAPVERTVFSINAEGLEPDEVDAFIQANKDAAAKQLKSIEGKAPKMGTNIAKYKADKAAWQARVADAQAQVDYWNQVGDAISAQRTQVGDTTAEDIRAMGEPMNGHELAAMMLATGRLPLLQSDFIRETGYRSGEARNLFGLFASEANGGMTIERAGEQLMLADQEEGTNFFDPDDPNAGRNAILDVLAEVRTRGDLTNYIRRNREALAERERQAEYDAYADWCEREMHMTPEEYEAYQEYIAENNPYEGVAAEDLDRIFAEAEEAYHNNITSQHNGQEGTSENGSGPDSGPSGRHEPAGEAGGREAGIPVLPGAQPVLPGQVQGRAGGTETASGPADDGVRAAEGAVAEGASGGERGVSDIHPIGEGDFGPIYDQFVGKPKEAIDFLLSQRDGEAIGALHHRDIGDIDLVWGKEGTSKSDGYGLSKLAKYHPEVLDNLQEILDDMQVVKRTDNRVQLESEKYKAAIRLTWDGQRKNWLLTAFQKETPTAADRTTDIGDTELQNDTAPLQTVSASSEDKGSDKSELAQTSNEKTTKEWQPHALPGRLMKAYESGDEALIAAMEQEMRNFVNDANDMRSVYATYLRSKDLERSQEKGSPGNKTQRFIAEACKDVLKKAGLPVKAMQSERARTEIAGSITDARLLDIMSADFSFDVIRAIIKNPHTSNATLERFTKVYSNNGLDYDAQQELDKRKATPNEQTESEHLPDAGKMNREQEEAEKIQQQSGPVEKIEDVGEKIGGAKKDRFKEFTEKEKQIQEKPDSFMEELRKLPVSKIFNFNLEALRKDGLSNEAATLIDVIRRVIPSKPRTDWKLKRWVSDVFGLYRFCLTLATAEQGTFDQILRKATFIRNIGGMYRAQMALGGFDSGLDTGQATLEELGEGAGHYDKDDNWVSIKGQWYVTHAGRYGGIYPDYEKAKEALAQFAGENSKGKEKGTEVKFSVYNYKHSGEAFITPKGKPNIVVESGFKSSKEALNYLNEHMDELQAKYRNMKDATSIGFAPNGERRGKDWRGGKNVTAEDFRNTFGFRGVEFGNWANQQERQRALNQAYDAFMDLSEATGISPQGLSLGGELGMAFGARGGGGAAAHYEPGKVVINLTKTQGAGTLAHEWWHAIDNYFSRRRGQALGYNTERKGYNLPVRRGKVEREHEAERKEITNAFSALMKAINGSSYGERSNAYAGLKSSYWKEPTELGARAFAVWVERKLSEKGIVNNFLANNNTIGWESPELTQKYYPYPLESDFENLDVAFDNLFGAIEEKVDEETGNTILYRNGAGFLSDDALSVANDPFSKLLGKSTRTAKQRRAFAERERRNMAARVQELAEKLHLDNVEIVTDASTLQGRRAKAKGFFNPATGKITIVIPNQTSTFDAEQTLLHEAVAHYGLRQLFGEHFDTFLDNVFNNADVEVRRKIVALAQKNGWNTQVATEEYLASLAEDTNFDDLNASWWEKIKSLFLDMLHKIGFDGFTGVTLTDNELRYILWRSYENLRAPGSRRSILGQAEDIAKQYELKVGNYAPTAASVGQVAETANSAKAERIRKLRESKPVEITGEEYRGKYELNRDSAKQWIKDNLRGIYTNKDTGEKIEIRKDGAQKVTSHSMGNEAHLKSLAAIPQMIENSIFIDEIPNEKNNGKYDSYRYYVCGLKIGDVDYTVKVTVGVKGASKYYDHALTEIEKGKLIDNIDALSTTFDNNKLAFPEVKDTKLLSILQADSEENLLFRETPDGNTADDGTREAYNRAVSGNHFKAQEAYQDSMLALKRLQEVIEQRTGKLKSYENAYLAENQMSSKSTRETEVYGEKYFKPMLEAVGRLIKKGASYGEIIDYMVAKHGLERNEVFAERDARQEADHRYEKLYKELEQLYKLGGITEEEYDERKDKLDAEKEKYYLERLAQHLDEDYSGLTALRGKHSVVNENRSSISGELEQSSMNTENRPTPKEFARQLVADFEQKHDTRDLWAKVNAATKETLRKSYESGMMSRDTYNKVKEQFKHYIPLRGWDEQTAEDVYEYLRSETSPVNSVLRAAKGRRSLADDPLATIGNMAESAVLQGNRNLMKQAFLNMAINHPTDVLTLKEAWYVQDPSTGEWTLSFPDIQEGDDADTVAAKVEEHEQRMQELKADGLATQVKEGLNINYRIGTRQAQEHIVTVKRNGRDYLIFVNGNPRAAQAVNGLTNPTVESNKLLSGIARFNRELAANFTNRNPAFVLSNLSRDLIFSVSAVAIKENPKYAARFARNIPRAMQVIFRNLRGKGSEMNADDRMFEEFLTNGGETGYTSLHSVDEYKKMVQRSVGKYSGKKDYFAAVRSAAGFFSMMNRWAEDVSRFTTYMTSREEGRTITESVNDAKEVTVNFNRRGAATKTSGVFGWTSGLFRNLYLFFNAAVQSLTNFARLAKKNRKGFLTALGGFTAAGFLAPWLNALAISMLGGDARLGA